MKFWDSSAIVPLVTGELQSEKAYSFLSHDRGIIVWSLSLTEVYSALYRKLREGKLSELELVESLSQLSLLQQGWSEITQIESVRLKANRLLAVHPLRAADALQLAAALIAFEDNSEGKEVVTFDNVLALAAKREGFTVLTSPDPAENS